MTVRHWNSTGVWNTIPVLDWGPVTGEPFTSTSPPVLSSRPAMIFMMVVLPQPLCPTSETNSCSWTSKVASSNATMGASLDGYTLVSRLTSMAFPASVIRYRPGRVRRLPMARAAPGYMPKPDGWSSSPMLHGINQSSNSTRTP